MPYLRRGQQDHQERVLRAAVFPRSAPCISHAPSTRSPGARTARVIYRTADGARPEGRSRPQRERRDRRRGAAPRRRERKNMNRKKSHKKENRVFEPRERRRGGVLCGLWPVLGPRRARWAMRRRALPRWWYVQRASRRRFYCAPRARPAHASRVACCAASADCGPSCCCCSAGTVPPAAA